MAILLTPLFFAAMMTIQYGSGAGRRGTVCSGRSIQGALSKAVYPRQPIQGDLSKAAPIGGLPRMAGRR